MIIKEDYFAKHEQKRRGHAMIIMDIKVDNMFAFRNFHLNMSYPKKIVDSMIDGEYLKERPNFRYKKVNIIMGSNAVGKTSLGRLLMVFANYFEDGECGRFLNIIDDKQEKASLVIDFVTDENLLYRFSLHTVPKNATYTEKNVSIVLTCTEIGKKDNYETCKKRLDESECRNVEFYQINTEGWSFFYPQDARKSKIYYSIEDDERYLYILEQILKTLDPSVREVVKVQEIENTYAVKLENHSAIIRDGKIVETEILSSGTKAGLDISYIIASLICDKHSLYYCDELFSYVNSDIEKACLSIIIDKLDGRKQLFFTTHNTDILDVQLPKHSFTFLKKDVNDKKTPVTCINAGQYLKRNTDSLKHAVENDLFCTTPDLDKLYKVADL